MAGGELTMTELAKVFKDTAGREWRPAVTLAVAREIQRQAGVNLLNTDSLTQIGENLNIQVECLWQSVAAQANARDIKRESFEAALDADILEVASDAFLAAVIDFFPSAKRPILRRMLAAISEQQREATERMEKLLPGTGEPLPSSAPAPAAEPTAGQT
jgi:hypothetical protein